MIDINFNNKYDAIDATFEIILMLSIAFVLGYFLCFYIFKSNNTQCSDEETKMKNNIKLLKKALDNCMNEKVEIKKNVTLEYAGIVDEYKLKLNQAREDLEKCLADKMEKY